MHLQVSRVLKLPIPAYSTQLLGKEFVGEEGRGANLIDIGGGAVQVQLATNPKPKTLRVRLATLCVQRPTGSHSCPMHLQIPWPQWEHVF